MRTTALMLVLAAASWGAGGVPPGQDQEAKTILETAKFQGGLVVHLDCNDGRLTAALKANESTLVHGLDTNPEDVAKAREHLLSKGLAGKVSVSLFDGTRLPFVDGTVNLLVADDLGGITMEEVMRALAPNSVACIREGGAWKRHVKPRPEDIDEWTHFLHGPDNNAVGDDGVVSVPFNLQWVDDPAYARNHNHLSSTSAAVSTGGRVFMIQDEGSIASLLQPPQWALVARDAFSGVRLWSRPVGPWENHLRRFRSGPNELPRRLVAVGERVFVTLGYGKPVVALDAATGKTVRTYAGSEGAHEILYDAGRLFLVLGVFEKGAAAEKRKKGTSDAFLREKYFQVVDAGTGKLLWKKSDETTAETFAATLCVSGGRVFFQNPASVVCLDAESGRELWSAPRPSALKRLGWSTPTLVAHGGVVLSADFGSPEVEKSKPRPDAPVQWTVSSKPKRGASGEGKLIAFSAKDGSRMWSCPSAQGYTSPPDVFVADGLVWTSTTTGINETNFTEGRDLKTGEVRRKLDAAGAFTETHHHRCFRNKATHRFIFVGRTGTAFLPLDGDKPLRNCWVRGACQYGVLPCNGLMYFPPHSCACYIQSKINGTCALAPRRGKGLPVPVEEGRFVKGPAWRAEAAPAEGAKAHDWPIHRHDAARSGRTASPVAARPAVRWNAKLGGRLTAPVVGEGVLCVASTDTHVVHALDAEKGNLLWSFTAGGRVDSPPTIHKGTAIFGSADGWITSLRLADGRLAWRFRAAPQDLRLVARGQVESVWPVTGSVLVHDGIVYATAGRSSFLDGGMWLVRLDAVTGKKIGERRIYTRNPETGKQLEDTLDDVEMPGALPDVLALQGKDLFLRDRRMDPTGKELPPDVHHLYSSVGFLDDNWWHRTYWVFATQTFGRASGWAVMASHVPSGRIMAMDEKTVFGFGRKRVGAQGMLDASLHLFRADQKVIPGKGKVSNNNKALERRLKPSKARYHWSRTIPIVARALVLSKDVLIAAGPRMASEGAREPRFEKGEPAALLIVKAGDGETIHSIELKSQPVFDGMIVANGKLYLSSVDGSVSCLGGK